jgi:cyclase
MQRRTFLRTTGIITGASLLFHKQALAQLFRTAEFKITMLRNNVGIFTERGGTIGFLLSKDGVVVIDAQFPETSIHLIEELKTKTTSPIKYLLNTHHHRDHTGGNINFKGIVEHVVAHENALTNQKNVAAKSNNADSQLFPDLTFTEEYKLKWSDETLKGDYYGAGHTNGDAIYHFESANIMHVGDLMFNKRHPVIDRSAGASIKNWVKVHDKIIKKANKDTIIIFGHSLNPGEETGSIEEVKKFQDYLGKVLSYAEAEFKKGVTREDFIKNTSIPGVTEWSGQGIERALTAAYEEVSTSK